ncbi:hypothetical protein JX266_013476 [Neoarthrinium moseri]|nr:hypothetical protein JX266_013476 [Neoarthrinium moseri]
MVGLNTYAKKYSDPMAAEFAHLWEYALKGLQYISPYTLVIDSLDGFPDSEKSPCFNQVLRDLEGLCQKPGNQVILLHRPDPRLSLSIEHISISLSSDLAQSDINTFFFDEYRRHGLESSCFDDAAQKIRDCAAGNFVFIQMSLQHLNNAVTDAQLRRRLNHFPTTLGDLYRSIAEEKLRSLDPDQLQARRHFFMTVSAARRTLTVSEFACMLDLRAGRAEKLISELCDPFLEIHDGFVQFSHHSVGQHLSGAHGIGPPRIDGYAIDEAYQSHAEDSIKVLLDKKYQNLGLIGNLLRSNVNKLLRQQITSGDVCPDGAVNRPSYDYAARHWVLQLKAVREPTTELVRLVDNFIRSRQSVHWAETVSDPTLQNSPLVVARKNLRSWHQGLPQDLKSLLDLGQYIVQPYREISEAFLDESGNIELKLFSLLQLGYFLFAIGDAEQTYLIRQDVASGLEKLRGPNDPLVVRVRVDAAFTCYFVGEMSQALRDFKDLYRRQCALLGPEALDTLRAMAYVGISELFLTDFPAANATLQKVWGLLRKNLPEGDSLVLSTELMQGWTLDQDDQLRPAVEILHHIYEKRENTFGADDGLAVMALYSMANVNRKLGKSHLAIEQMEAAYTARLKIWERTNFHVVDLAISLTIAYRDDSRLREARELIGSIELDENIPSRFYRHCQITHLRALLGTEEHAINILRQILASTERQHNNRALLWTRIDLAVLLRRRHLNDEADLLFEGLVTQSNGKDPDDEPDPPQYLAIAEKALTLIRGGSMQSAKNLLDQNGLKWTRPRDFWLLYGGPAADTRVMRALDDTGS